MLLLKTSINLRDDLSWSMIYNECIYPWLDGSVDKQGRRNYQALLDKLDSEMEIGDEDSGEIYACKDYLKYNSFVFGGCKYLCFVHGTDSEDFSWRTSVALKKDAGHLFCFVSLEYESKGARKLPRISKPRIIDHLIKFQAGDGDVDYEEKAHILTNAEIVDAKNVLLGKKKNRLPIIYLSCAEHSYAIPPDVLARQLFGLAHVYAEEDKFVSERVRQEIKTKIPQRGSIGVCYPGKPIVIINRNGAKEKDFVWSIYLSILKSSLSAQFDFSWSDFIEAQSKREKELAENEKRSALEVQKKEKKVAEQEARKSRENIEKNSPANVLQGGSYGQTFEKIKTTVQDFKKAYKALHDSWKAEAAKSKELHDSNLDQKKLIAELNQQIANLKSDNAKLEEQNKNLKSTNETYEEMIELDDQQKKELAEKVGTLEAKVEWMQEGLSVQKKRGGNHIPLFLPAEEEMYENEYLYQLVNLLKRAETFLPPARGTPVQRSVDVMKLILKANPDAVKSFEKKDSEKEVLESYACKSELKTLKGQKAMEPFNLAFAKKKNNHGKLCFAKDESERYLGSEACTPSDKKRGSMNSGKNSMKALLW